MEVQALLQYSETALTLHSKQLSHHSVWHALFSNLSVWGGVLTALDWLTWIIGSRVYWKCQLFPGKSYRCTHILAQLSVKWWRLMKKNKKNVWELAKVGSVCTMWCRTGLYKHWIVLTVNYVFPVIIDFEHWFWNYEVIHVKTSMCYTKCIFIILYITPSVN